MVPIPSPFKFSGVHEVFKDLVCHQLPALLELRNRVLQQLNHHLLKLTGKQTTSLVVVVDGLQFVVVLFEIGKIDIRDVNIWIPA